MWTSLLGRSISRKHAAVGASVKQVTDWTAFLSVRSEVAILYNDRSVLENHHVSAAYKLMAEEDMNILVNLNKDDWRSVLAHICTYILWTDSFPLVSADDNHFENAITLSEPNKPKLAPHLEHNKFGFWPRSGSLTVWTDGTRVVHSRSQVWSTNKWEQYHLSTKKDQNLNLTQTRVTVIVWSVPYMKRLHPVTCGMMAFGLSRSWPKQPNEPKLAQICLGGLDQS